MVQTTLSCRCAAIHLVHFPVLPDPPRPLRLRLVGDAGLQKEMCALCSNGWLLPSLRPVVGQIQQVIDTDFVKTRQRDQGRGGNIQRAAFVAGIGCLTDMEQICKLLLGQICVLPQVSNVLTQCAHLERIIAYEAAAR